MPFRDDGLQYIVIPATAGPGQARIVITSALPPPLSTYTFTDRAGYGPTTYAGGIIFYNTDTTPPIDDTYTYLAVVQNSLGVFSALHMGEVQGGSVREVSAGVPAVQIWSTEPSSVNTQKWLSAGFSVLEAYAPTGEAVLRGLNGALVRITNNGSGAPIIISATGAGADVTITVTDVFSIAAGSVDIGAATINLNATTEVRIKSTRAYMLTQIQTNLCTPALSPIPNAYTDIGNCSITLPTVTTNARYKVSVSANLGMNPAGLTIVNVRLLVDGAAQTQQITAHMHEVQRDNEAQFWTGTLATAGNHTFKIQARDQLTSGVCDVAADDTTITVEIFETGGP